MTLFGRWLFGCSSKDSVAENHPPTRRDGDSPHQDDPGSKNKIAQRAYDETPINPIDQQDEWLARFECAKTTLSSSPSTDQTEANTGDSSSSSDSSCSISHDLDFQVKTEPEPQKCMSMSLMESFWEDYDSEADEDVYADAQGLSHKLRNCSLKNHELQKQVFGDFLKEDTTASHSSPSRAGDESISNSTLHSSMPELNYAFERIKAQGESELDYVLKQMQVTRKPTNHISIFLEQSEPSVGGK